MSLGGRASPDLLKITLVIAKIFILWQTGKWFVPMKICGNLPLIRDRGLPQPFFLPGGYATRELLDNRKIPTNFHARPPDYATP